MIIIIVHRLSTIEGCDAVYRAENGKLMMESRKLNNIKKENNNRIYRIWIIYTMGLILAAFVLVASATFYVDPFFHYRAPRENLAYPLSNERYQNDGIMRHFKYDGIITGSSMTENFKTSEADWIFDADFIKIPFSGARYKEINDNLKQAWASGKEVKYVIRCLDYTLLVEDKDSKREDVEYPDYLYDDDLLNDVNYIFNKEVLYQTLSVLLHTVAGDQTTDFDDYENWSSSCSFGAETVLNSYELGKRQKICGS